MTYGLKVYGPNNEIALSTEGVIASYIVRFRRYRDASADVFPQNNPCYWPYPIPVAEKPVVAISGLTAWMYRVMTLLTDDAGVNFVGHLDASDRFDTLTTGYDYVVASRKPLTIPGNEFGLVLYNANGDPVFSGNERNLFVSKYFNEPAPVWVTNPSTTTPTFNYYTYTHPLLTDPFYLTTALRGCYRKYNCGAHVLGVQKVSNDTIKVGCALEWYAGGRSCTSITPMWHFPERMRIGICEMSHVAANYTDPSLL